MPTKLKWKTDLEKGVVTHNFIRRGWSSKTKNNLDNSNHHLFLSCDAFVVVEVTEAFAELELRTKSPLLSSPHKADST